jgi:hypothetical protein
MAGMKRFPVVTSALLLLAANALAQPRDEAPSIIVAGRIESRRLTVTAADLGSLPKKTVKVKTDHGVTTFEGVAIQDVLELAGVLFGKKLQGARLVGFVVIEGAPPSLQDLNSQFPADDYRALFSLPELDRDFNKEQPILAITQNGKPLGSADGPYRVVVPQDANHIRWIRDVKMIWVLHADTILGGTTRY